MVEIANKGVLSIRNIDRQYVDPVGRITQALEKVSLDINPGEWVSIIGPSGCGKSTLLRLIAGLDQPTAGEIHLDDDEINGPHYSRGFVFQDPTLYPWKTVWNNVATGLEARGVLKERRSEVDEYIDLVGLQGFEDSYPHQISGGMAQRVAIARTLINHPKVLLMDEPLGALDAFTRMTMQDEILRIWQERKMTAVLVTHDVDEAIYLSDRVVIMSARPGQIKDVLDIHLERPRKRSSDEFLNYRTKILKTLNFG